MKRKPIGKPTDQEAPTTSHTEEPRSKRGSYHRTTEVTRNERHKRLYESLRLTLRQKEFNKACDAFNADRGINPSDSYEERFHKGVAASMRTRKPITKEVLFESKKWKTKPQETSNISLSMLLLREVALAARRNGTLKDAEELSDEDLALVEFKQVE